MKPLSILRTVVELVQDVSWANRCRKRGGIDKQSRKITTKFRDIYLSKPYVEDGTMSHEAQDRIVPRPSALSEASSAGSAAQCFCSARHESL